MILFNLLLRLFPTAFREAFGDEMRCLFIDQQLDARGRGSAATIQHWARTVTGMTAAAWRERRDARRIVSGRPRVFETLVADLRLTSRMLRARPLFTFVIVAAISVGVGGVATRAWPGLSPAGAVGMTILSGTRPVTIVGVAADSKYSTIDEPATPFVYRPQAQRWDPGRTLFVRVNGDPASAARIIQGAVESIDPLLPRTTVTTLTREAETALLPQRVAAMVTGVLGVAGLFLAATGLYGLISYGVALRLREIGVRLALGASRGDVLRMILGQGLRLTAVATALGLVASAFATRLVASYLLNVSAMDGVAFTGAVVLLLAVATLAALVPARRAGVADPLIVLRTE